MEHSSKQESKIETSPQGSLDTSERSVADHSAKRQCNQAACDPRELERATRAPVSHKQRARNSYGNILRLMQAITPSLNTVQ